MRHLAVVSTLFVALSLSAQAAFSHDTDTARILRELRELREDLDAFLIPADVSGRWQFDNDASCSGNLPEWIVQAITDAASASENSFRLGQYGNHLAFDEKRADGRTVSFSGTIRGDYIRLERDIDISGSSGIFDWTFVSNLITNATVLSPTRIRYVAHLDLALETGYLLTTWESYSQTCTGEWQRIGDWHGEGMNRT